MKKIHSAALIVSLIAALGSPIGAMAQANGQAVAIKAAEPADLSDGEVKKIDKDAGKITLKHGDIKNLDMPGMTMVFGVKDKSLFDTVKAGDKVKFKATSESGKLFVTEIHGGK